MRSFLIIALAFVTGCVRGVIAEECPEDTDSVDTDTEVVDTDDTGTEDTAETDEPVQPLLIVEFTPDLTGYGDLAFQSGEQEVSFGSFLLMTNTFATVQSIQVQGFVSDSPGLFAYYTPGAEGGVRFADHFTNCKLVNVETGSVYMGPTEPEDNGTLNFTEDFTLDDTSGMILNLRCDHTGLEATGDFDGFAVDITSDLNVQALDESGQYEPVDLRVRNGGDNPSTARILMATAPEPVCEPFEWSFDNYSTTSKPVLQLWTTEMFYPSSRDWFSGHGMFYTASGCGTGYSIVDAAVLLDNLPANTDFSATQMTIAVGGNTYNMVCDATDGEVWCIAHGVNVDVRSGENGVAINFTATDVPLIPVGHGMVATVYYHWRDLDTGNAYQANGWAVEIADSMIVRPY